MGRMVVGAAFAFALARQAVANEPVDLIEIIEKDAAVEPTDQVFDAKETVRAPAFRRSEPAEMLDVVANRAGRPNVAVLACGARPLGAAEPCPETSVGAFALPSPYLQSLVVLAPHVRTRAHQRSVRLRGSPSAGAAGRRAGGRKRGY